MQLCHYRLFKRATPTQTVCRHCILLVLTLLCACKGSTNSNQTATLGAGGIGKVFEGPVPQASCAAGAQPETDIQGRVSMADRLSGRSEQGYWCNLDVIGRQGSDAGIMMTWYKNCAYYSGPQGKGTYVIDVSDPTNPVLTDTLTSKAMLDPWESLKASQSKGLLAATFSVFGPSVFDLYDVSNYCGKPVALSLGPVLHIGHEGGWSPDGNTFWASGASTTVITAIDVSNSTQPVAIKQWSLGQVHGVSISDDGNRAYVAQTSAPIEGGGGLDNGLSIYDISEVQNRTFDPKMTLIGSVYWNDGGTSQHAIPITIGGHPYAIFVDEALNGAVRIIDIGDETAPFVVSKLRLQIHMPENQVLRDEDGDSGILSYDGHYCSVATRDDPEILICNMMWSGLRVFDIRNPMKPIEVAYYNETPTGRGGTGGHLQPRFIPERGEVWFAFGGSGFFVARLTPNVWPLK
jgi:hypothetical protein